MQKIEEPENVEVPSMELDSSDEVILEPEVSLEINLEKVINSETQVSLEIVPEEAITPVPIEESAMKNTEVFFDAMETYKKTFLSEVKDEIRTVVRKEVLDEVRKEISKGT